jgi:hypothetical protein
MDRKKPTEIETHETFANLFPIKPEVLSKIEEHITENQFLISHPLDLATWGDMKKPICIDGHTRLQAALNLGLDTVPVITHELESEDEALELAIHLQKNRRNMTDAEIVACTQALDKRCQRGGDRRSEEARSKPQDYGNENSRSSSAKKTAELVGVSTRKVEQIRTITDHGESDIIESVKSGEISINKGYQETQKKRKAKVTNETGENGSGIASPQPPGASETSPHGTEDLVSLAEVCELFGEDALELAEDNKIPHATDQQGNWIKNKVDEPLFHPLCKEIAEISGILGCIVEAYENHRVAHEPEIEWEEISYAFAVFLLQRFYQMIPTYSNSKDLSASLNDKLSILRELNTDVLERLDDYDFSSDDSEEEEH